MGKRLNLFVKFLLFVAVLSYIPLVGNATTAAEKNRPLGVLIVPLSKSIPSSPTALLKSQPATEVLTNQRNQYPSLVTKIPFPAIPNKATKGPLGILLINKHSNNEPQIIKTPKVLLNPINTNNIYKYPKRPQPLVSGASKDRPLGLLLGSKIKPLLDIPPSYKTKTQLIKKAYPISTKEKGTSNAVNFTADELSHDEELGIVTARGRVRLDRGDQKLGADVISYNEKTGIVSASGNVIFRDPATGHRVFADYAEITGDFKNGIIENIGILLQDYSRLAAAGARRSGGRILEMDRGVYSPCNLCPDDPSMSPIWQIKAVKVIHDQKQQTVEYRDAWLEVSGFPVFYTPFFVHPDPTVKRKTGFLFPTFNSTNKLGFVTKTPFYWAINSYSDATITPIITTSEGSGLMGEYRELRETSKLQSTASIIFGDSQENIRANLDARKSFLINKNWEWGVHVQRSTDDTYLRRYRIATSDNYLSRYGGAASNSLVSNIYAEGISNRNYFSANGYLFQDQTAATDPGEVPLILPLISYNHFGDIDTLGGYSTLDINMLNLHRDHGSDLQRLSFRPSWNRPLNGKYGDIYKFTIAADADFYHSQDYYHDNGTKFTAYNYRLVPRAALEGRLPFVLEGRRFNQILEPIVTMMWSPNGGNPPNIPNEDSAEVEFDDTNLFSSNRFSGIDRIEGGPRISYGVKWGLYGRKGGSTSFLIGQSFRARDDSTFSAGTGLEENFSDIVGRVQVAPGENIDLFYRTRFSPDNLSPNRNELEVSAGVPALMVSANYIFLDQAKDSEFPGREELSGDISSQITSNWKALLNARQDLSNKELRSLGTGLQYENECIKFKIKGTRSFFEDRDIEPEDTISFNIALKTLSKQEQSE